MDLMGHFLSAVFGGTAFFAVLMAAIGVDFGGFAETAVLSLVGGALFASLAAVLDQRGQARERSKTNHQSI